MQEAVAQTCSVKNLQACNFINKETLAQVFSYEFCEISKNTFFYRTPLVAASAMKIIFCMVKLWKDAKNVFPVYRKTAAGLFHSRKI